MAWTTLFVALGDRLDLPLHGVIVPGHIFVRWDDGSARLNFDPSNGGVSLLDAVYAEDIPATEQSSRWLRNLTPRELVAQNLANSALWTEGVPGVWKAPFTDRSLRLAELATGFDPRDPGTWINLSVVASQLGDSHRETMRGAARRATRTETASPSALLDAIGLLAAAGDAEAALDLVEQCAAAAHEPARLTLRHGQALHAVGRTQEALTLVRDLPADTPPLDGRRLLRALCLLELDQDAGRRAVDALDAESAAPARVHAELLFLILSRPADDEVATRLAWELAAPFAPEGEPLDSRGWDGNESLFGMTSRFGVPRSVPALRSLLLSARDRHDALVARSRR